MKFFNTTLITIALVTTIGCQEKELAIEKHPPVLKTQVEKQGYALGASIGIYMQGNLEQQKKMGVTLDQALITKGFTDSLAGNSLIEKEEIQSLLVNLEQTMQTKHQALALSTAEESLINGQAFLTENAKKTGVKVTNSGLQYSIIIAAEGKKPTATDTVKVHYQGTLITGEAFDSSYERGEPVVFPLNRVIAGFTEAIQLMAVGAKFKFTFPPELAYGAAGNPPEIPGNSVLEFEIELLEIQATADNTEHTEIKGE